jgi:hypothetical protein
MVIERHERRTWGARRCRTGVTLGPADAAVHDVHGFLVVCLAHHAGDVLDAGPRTLDPNSGRSNAAIGRIAPEPLADTDVAEHADLLTGGGVPADIAEEVEQLRCRPGQIRCMNR